MAGHVIQPLSPGVRSYLRTGVALCSVAQCMEELVLNSVDAGATCVAVRIDLSCFKIQVVDNGTGMTKGQLELVGQRYHTSKCHTMDDLNQLCHYGYRGEAIASLRDASSVLEITSRTKHLTQTFCKIFNKATPTKVMPSSVPRPSAGTTVTVHDVFYNMPVRKKAMNPVLEFERVRKRLEGIALMRPAISFSLRNDITGNLVLQTHKTNGVLNVFTSLFGIGRSKTLSPVQGQSGCFSVEGYIGKEGFSKKDLQFVYINKRLVLKTKIHKVINCILGKSLILRKKGVGDRQGEGKQQESVLSVTSSPTKYSEKFGVFVVNVSCPYTEYDVTFDPAKTLVEFKDWDTLCTCIGGVVSEFLKRECLLLGIQDMMAEERATSSENNKSGDSAEISSDGEQTSTSGDSTKPVTEQISTSSNRNFLTSKLVKRQAKNVSDQTEVCEDENVIETYKGLDATEDQEKATDIESLEKIYDNKLVQNKESDKNLECGVEEAMKSTSQNVSSSDDATESITDHTVLSSTNSSNVKGRETQWDRKGSDSDDRDHEVNDKFDEDEDYESEDPVPKFEWNFRRKGKEFTNAVEKQRTIIRLETPHLGCNGGSTLSLIRKRHSSSNEKVRGKSSNPEKISCFKSMKKKLHCDKTSDNEVKRSDYRYQSEIRQHSQKIDSTKTSELSLSDTFDASKTTEVLSHRKLTEQNNEEFSSSSSNRNGADEIRRGGTLSQEGHVFKLSHPQKRISELEESSVAAKLARLTRSRRQKSNDVTGQVFGIQMEEEFPVSSPEDTRSETYCTRSVSVSECQQEMVTSKENKSGNGCDSFETSYSVLFSDRAPNSRSLKGGDSNINNSSDSTRKMVDSPTAPKKFLTTASFVQTYDDVFQNHKPSKKNVTMVDTSNSNDFRSDTFKLGCYTEFGTLENKQMKSNQGFKPLKTNSTVDHSQILFDKKTEMVTFHGGTEDMSDIGSNTQASFCINDEGAHFPSISSESEADIVQDIVLFEGTPKSIDKLDIDQGDVHTEDSNTDLLCYEEFDYAPTPVSKEKSYHRNTQQSSQTSDNSLRCQQNQTFPDPVVPRDYQGHDIQSTLQQEGQIYNINTSLSHRDGEGYSELTTQTSEGFVPGLSSLETCPSSKGLATQGSDTTQSQGFVPISDLSAVIDKQVLMESLQESQGFVPVPAFTEERVISPAVSEGFSPVMMDDDMNVKLNSDTSNPSGNKRLCNDSNVNSTVISTTQGSETLAEYLDSYSSSIAELYEEDMSYVKKKKRSKSCRLPYNRFTTVESSEQSESSVRDVAQDSSLSLDISTIRSQSLSNLSEDSFPTQLTNDLFKTQARFRTDFESSVSQISVDPSILTQGHDHCQQIDSDKGTDSVGNDGEKGSGSEGNGGEKGTRLEESDFDEVSSEFTVKNFTHKTNLDSLSCNESMERIENLDCGQQSHSHIDLTNVSGVNRFSLSHEKARCVQCESIAMQESSCASTQTAVVADKPRKGTHYEGETTMFNSITEGMCNKLDDGNCQVSYSGTESFQNCPDRIQDANKRISYSSQFVGNIADQSNSVPENTSDEHFGYSSSDRSEEQFNVEGLSSKQLKVFRESNRKGKLPKNFLDICDISQVNKTDISAKPDRSTDTPTHQWSDDDDDLVAVVKSVQSHGQQSEDVCTNKTATTADNHSNREQPWMEIEDPKTGEKLYVNCLTGHTRPRDGSWEPPPLDKKTTSPSLTTPSGKNAMLGDLSPQSHNTLLHIMSDHLETLDKEEEDLLSVKWAGTRCSSERKEDSQTTDVMNTRCVEDLLEDWDNPVFSRPEQAIATAVEVSGRSRGTARVNSVLHSHKFTKDMLQDVKVVGQVDNKFIACMTSSRTNNMAADPNLMLLFDQHAAHERVRLERLTKEAYEGDNRISRSIVTPAQHLTLEQDEVRVMVSYKAEFSRIGVDFSEDKQERDSIYVHTIPACIMQKEVNEVKRKRDSIAWNVVLNLLKEHVELLIGTSGVLGRLPATIHKVLCSQACHGAIKFGDQLSVDECEELLSSLAQCDLPFQCAHGRPSIMPLLEMDKLQPGHTTTKPNLWKISKHLQKI
ncbi:uncharacterized protein LOC110450333 [Mizuhopecten yessoensis]|uniref:DNA mismatch repair protein Mlh3 n=1 Tax=Mizuhopecten yessoensis TaxID=6573 RepID=A0A210QP30_MIZYE|nr:uncharacterized protein LOC110450333 [Mizuhopecten yessoensis]OWF50497.1 DNA mismatch repair protein Mlh3 [Mizuhopecten yessoensis]